MDIEKIKQFEEFLFTVKNKDIGVALCMADVIGVLIGVKPAACLNFGDKEMGRTKILDLKEKFEDLGLKCVFDCRYTMFPNRLRWYEDVYVSKDFSTAIKLKNSFTEVRESVDDIGQVIDKESWKRATRQTGKILGYPDVAVECFIRNWFENRDIDNSLTTTEKPYRFFAHSKEHAEEEAKIYDTPINIALKKYAPKSYSVLEEQ